MDKYRVRSQSPTRRHRSHRVRSRSPRPHRERHRSHGKRDAHQSITLPYNSQTLSKHDLSSYRPLFASYLDIQKQILIEDLEEDEVRGRWKSFINKWNHGDIAEGWYDPKVLFQAQKQSIPGPSSPKRNQLSSDEDGSTIDGTRGLDEDDGFGPAIPSQITAAHSGSWSRGIGAGPSIPTTGELREKRVFEAEEAQEARAASISALRAERRADRTLQRERLEEIAPRAEGGTKERQLEKKRETAAANRSFAEARERSPEVGDNDLMGGEGDDLVNLKRRKKEEERKKNERELRKEEALRARAAEREVKLKGLREKEEKTMAYLKELARARFGNSGL